MFFGAMAFAMMTLFEIVCILEQRWSGVLDDGDDDILTRKVFTCGGGFLDDGVQ